MSEAEFAQPFTDSSVEIPAPVATGNRSIFTVADLIPQSVKSKVPGYKHGGTIDENALTLAYRDGYMRRCEITELRQGMPSEEAAMFAPGERKHMARSYNINERNPATGEVVTRTIGRDVDGSGKVANRRYIPFYPANEVSLITSRGNGTVEMPVKNAKERYAAQIFLFPQWDEITNGTKALPVETSKLRAYFVTRLQAARDSGNPFYIAICEAAIASCDNFKTYCDERCRNANGEYDKAKTNGYSWEWGEQNELLFDQSGIQRRDNLVAAQSDQMGQIADVVTRLANLELNRQENQQQQQSPPLTPAPAPAAAEDLTETEIEVQTPPAEEEEVDEPTIGETDSTATEPEYGLCKGITGKGSECKNEAEEDGYCKIPSHKEQGSAV